MLAVDLVNASVQLGVWIGFVIGLVFGPLFGRFLDLVSDRVDAWLMRRRLNRPRLRR